MQASGEVKKENPLRKLRGRFIGPPASPPEPCADTLCRSIQPNRGRSATSPGQPGRAPLRGKPGEAGFTLRDAEQEATPTGAELERAGSEPTVSASGRQQGRACLGSATVPCRHPPKPRGRVSGGPCSATVKRKV